ncbi:hypothetical protein AMST5_00122 [freshwater sediment metagenome]|uniref:DUF5681 domain-containing protein n=1 Tax=freshwater sediment metagenome TaxID=556182 RepID=A0AA48LWV4_9ZZZZ
MSKSRRPSQPSGYEVGYGRPPQSTRFQPGCSGNPRGRPRKAKTVGALLQQGLSRRVEISENGRTRSLSAEEIIVKQLINKAAKGDLRAAKMLFDLKDRYQDSPQEHLDPIDLQANQEIIDAFVAKLGAGEPAPDSPAEPEAGRVVAPPAAGAPESDGEEK